MIDAHYTEDCINGTAYNDDCTSPQDCFDWCQLRVDQDGNNLTWPMDWPWACEFEAYYTYCYIYGNATILEGDGDTDVTCWAYSKNSTIYQISLLVLSLY